MTNLPEQPTTPPQPAAPPTPGVPLQPVPLEKSSAQVGVMQFDPGIMSA